MGTNNKTFFTLTIITAIVTLIMGDIFSDSFFNNLLAVPIWLFGCFFLGGIVFMIPYFMIDYLSKTISNYFLTINEKTKKNICIITVLVVWIALSILGTYIH